MPLRSIIDYKNAFAVVREAINIWDPYDLISNGAPQDEWDSEVASIVAQIPCIRNATDTAHAVSRTFTRSLGHEGFDPYSCSEVGAHIYAELVEARILKPDPACSLAKQEK